MSKAHSIPTSLYLGPRSAKALIQIFELSFPRQHRTPHTQRLTPSSCLSLPVTFFAIALLLLLLTHTLYPKGVFASHLLPALLFFRPPKLLSSLLTCTYLPLLSSSHSPSFPPSSFFATHLFSKEATFSIEYFCSRLIQLRLFNIRLSIFLNRDWIHRSLSNCLHHHHLNRRPNRVRNHCRIIGPSSKRFP